jgi:cell division protease FtsH
VAGRGRSSFGRASFTVHTLELIDEEVKRILAECADEAERTLAEHREQLDQLAEALLERETLDEADAYAAAGIPRPSASEQPAPTHA